MSCVFLYFGEFVFVAVAGVLVDVLKSFDRVVVLESCLVFV